MQERCLNQELEIWGSGSKPYIVRMVGKEGLPSCTCTAYAINRNRSVSIKPGVIDAIAWCKHLEGQFDRLCGWIGEPVIPGMCDNCSGPTEPVEVQE
jgi:hypothetical protein